MADPKLSIVRPFGLIGGDYEVDAVGVRKHRLAWVVAAAVIGLTMFRRLLGAPDWLIVAATVAGLLIILALCVDVVRKGRKI
jgi:ABC-type transport system involved in cytochrome bd biosynthesis fused ATPase/permease subunit